MLRDEDAPEELDDVAGFISPGVRDHAVKMLCCPTPFDAARWREVAKDGMTDMELRERLTTLWKTAVTRDMPPCAASSKMGPPLIWLGQNHTKGTPTYSGDELLDQVRRVMSIDSAQDQPAASTTAQVPEEWRQAIDVDTSDKGILKWTLRLFDWSTLSAGATERELKAAIAAAWKLASRKSSEDGPRKYRCVISDKDWALAIWTIADGLDGAPRWYGGGLMQTVRDICAVPWKDEQPAAQAVEDETKPKPKAKGKGKSPTAAAVAPVDPMVGVEVIEERDVPYDEIKRSPHNPRTIFDEQLIASMASAIETICKLNPLTIREGTNELIDGETRHRAAAARKPALRCKIVRCTDGQAAAIRLSSAVKRRDLDPIARARAMKALQESHGYTQKQVAEFAELKEQSSVSNLTRLLELPKAWQDRVISREIPAAEARDLVPWADEPEVMKEVESAYKESQRRDWSFNLDVSLSRAVLDCSRPLKDPNYYNDDRRRSVDLKPTDEQKELLRVREVKRGSRKESRAFNVPLWEELQAAAEKKRAEREAKRNEGKSKSTSKSGKGVDPKKEAENRKKQAEQFAKRLYRFRTAWYQAMAIARIEKASNDDILALLLFNSSAHGNNERASTCEKLLGTKVKHKPGHNYLQDHQPILAGLLAHKDKWSIARTMLSEQLASKFEGWNVTFSPGEIETTAIHLGVDLKRDWPKSFDAGAACAHLWDDFTAIWSKDQLVALLAVEWKVHVAPGSGKRGDLVEMINRCKNKPVPKAIADAKEVQLR